MKRKLISYFYLYVFLSLFSNLSAQTTLSCFEIQSILVDACQPPPIAGSSQEYRNEMLRFLVGPTPLNINTMDMVFGFGQFYQGIRAPDAITAAKTAELNATILSCGQLIEPIGGVLPPNSKVLWISSFLVSAATNSFANLGETVYVIYHNSTFSINAYFLNYAISGSTAAPDNINISITFGGSRTDMVSYFRPSLIMQNGLIGAGDGATVNFTFSGAPSYVNNGCFAPYTPFSAAWTNPNTICNSDPPLNLLTTVTGTPGGTFSGLGVTNNIFDPSAQSGFVFITYSVISGTCQRLLTQLIQVNSSQNSGWTAPSNAICQGSIVLLNPLITGGTGGTWSGTGVTGGTFNSTGLSGNIPITYTVGSGTCQSVSTQNIAVIASGNAAWTLPVTLCTGAASINLSSQITGSIGGTWSGSGVSSSGNFLPGTSAGSFPITYTVGSGTCQSVSTQNIAVIASGNAAWTVPINLCSNSAVLYLSTTITGTAGGNWTGTGVTAAGLFNPSLILGGSSSITYTVGTGTCQSISTQTILVGTSGSPAWTLPAPLCTGAASINLTTQITGSAGGTWLGTGVSSTGNFLPGTSAGSFPITYTVGSGTCQSVSTQNIAVIASGNAAWTVPINLCSNSAVLI